MVSELLTVRDWGRRYLTGLLLKHEELLDRSLSIALGQVSGCFSL